MTISIGGTGMSLITAVLIVVKAMGYINWSWLWVFAPIWLPIAVVVSVIALAFLVWTIIRVVEN